jgi:hypothetical protein
VLFDGLLQHVLAGVSDRPGEPYYNEPGLPDDPRRSAAYSEEARLLSLRGLLHLASRPLEACAGIVAAHLGARGAPLLERTRREHAGDAGQPGGPTDEPEPEPGAGAAAEPVAAEEPAAEPAAGPRPYASVGYRDRAGGFLRGLRELAAPPAAAAAADGLAPLAALQARRPRSRHSAARPCLRSGPAPLDTK